MHATTAPHLALARILVELGESEIYPAVVRLGDGSQPMTDARLGWRGDRVPRWNGFVAEPLFDRPTVERIAADLPVGEEQYRIEFDGDVAVLRNAAYEAEGSAPERVAPDADGRYAIGRTSWVWTEAGPDEGEAREVYVVEASGERTTLCAQCIADVVDPDAALADAVARDDTLHCLGCDWHSECSIESCIIAADGLEAGAAYPGEVLS